MVHQLDQFLLLADADIHTYNGSCEFCARCFNMKCEYNTDKAVNYIKANVTDVDWDEQSINNVQNSLQDMSNIIHEDLELVELRNQARKNKDWKESDRIRDILLSKGYSVKDTPEGTQIS